MAQSQSWPQLSQSQAPQSAVSGTDHGSILSSIRCFVFPHPAKRKAVPLQHLTGVAGAGSAGPHDPCDLHVASSAKITRCSCLCGNRNLDHLRRDLHHHVCAVDFISMAPSDSMSGTTDGHQSRSCKGCCLLHLRLHRQYRCGAPDVPSCQLLRQCDCMNASPSMTWSLPQSVGTMKLSRPLETLYLLEFVTRSD